jgi:hypothetical protein
MRSPKGVVDSDTMTQLRTRKAEIVEQLVRSQSPVIAPMMPRPSRQSSSCLLPLTCTQLLPWFFADKQQPRIRTLAFAFLIRGDLQFEALRKSVQALLQRHEALRTRIVVLDGVPKQRIEPPAEDFRLDLLDLVETPGDVRSLSDRHLKEFIHAAVDFSVESLFEVQVIRLAHDEHLLAVSIDHLISDGVSNEILKQELWMLYGQLSKGCKASLPAPPLQFADYAVWQESTYSAWFQTHGHYWLERLAGVPALHWPSDAARLERPQGYFDEYEISVDRQLCAALLRLAQRARTLPALVVLTAYVAAVGRWCKQSDFSVAVVDSGRYSAELIPMVGCLASQLYLRIQRSSDDTLADLLGFVQREFRSSCDHRDFDRVPALVPGFPTELLFNWIPLAERGCEDFANTPSAADMQIKRAGALEIDPITVSLDHRDVSEITTRIPFKLLMAWSQLGSASVARLGYDTRVFTHSRIEEFVRLFQLFLQALDERPLSRIDDINANA